jgi:hypothetical protein
MEPDALKALDALLSELIAVQIHQPTVPHICKIDLLKAFDEFRKTARIPVERSNDPEA